MDPNQQPSQDQNQQPYGPQQGQEPQQPAYSQPQAPAPDPNQAAYPQVQTEYTSPAYQAPQAQQAPAPPQTPLYQDPVNAAPYGNPQAAAPAPPPGGQQQFTQTPLQQTGSAKPNSTQNSLNIAEIRDGIVIMNDGGYRAVIMTKSINFDLMSNNEREGVEYAFQGFLNSLYFPIQIFIRSQKVDIRPYIDKLDQLRNAQSNMLLGILMDDYINFISIISQETNIMDKKFFIVIPFYPEINAQNAINSSKTATKKMFGGGSKKGVITINEPDLEKAKTELRNRVQAVMSGLVQIGLEGVALDTEELIELYYGAYNPDTATHQQMRDIGGLTAPVVTKGDGVASNPNLDRGL